MLSKSVNIETEILIETIEFLRVVESLSTGLIKTQTKKHRVKLENCLCEKAEVVAMADIWEK
jgi:hypothetical protein